MSHGYYIPRSGETFLERGWQRFVRRRDPVPSFPRTIQIQTLGGCNARCSFCPNTSLVGTLKQGRMDEGLYRKIIDEAVQCDVRRFSPYLMNEPLTDRRLPELIRYIADRKAAEAVTKINSNASLLDEEMARGLIEARLDRISCSVHGIRPEAYRESMGNLDLETTLRNIDRLLELKRELGASKPRVRVTMVKTTTLEPQLDEIRAYWGKRNVRVNVRGLSNRGDKDITGKGLNMAKWTPYRWCTDLFDQMFILWNGDAVMCCADWERTTILGNVGEQSLYEIWNGEPYRRLREKFLSGDVADILCGRCFREPDE